MLHDPTGYIICYLPNLGIPLKFGSMNEELLPRGALMLSLYGFLNHQNPKLSSMIPSNNNGATCNIHPLVVLLMIHRH